MAATPQSLDDELLRALRNRLAQLDKEHARARSPKRRRELERKMEEVQAEAQRIEALWKVVDLSYERWRREFEKFLRRGEKKR